MATQAPAGGGAMMAMPSSSAMMMPQPTGGGGGGGPAGPALQANASLGLFSAADNGLAQDEVAIGIDLGGEWVRASVWDADQKRVVALDLDGFGGPLRAVCHRGLEPSTADPRQGLLLTRVRPTLARWWPFRGPRRPWWARRRSARPRRSTRSSVRSDCWLALTPNPNPNPDQMRSGC